MHEWHKHHLWSLLWGWWVAWSDETWGWYGVTNHKSVGVVGRADRLVKAWKDLGSDFVVEMYCGKDRRIKYWWVLSPFKDLS